MFMPTETKPSAEQPTHSHNWHFIRVVTETAEKNEVTNQWESVFKTKWVCSECGEPKILEHRE